MRDYQASLEKLRRDAAECALIRDLATDEKKRDVLPGWLSILVGLPMRSSTLWLRRRRKTKNPADGPGQFIETVFR
jgi:hypothetical protein